MDRDDLKTLLDGRTDGDFVDREVLERRPWIFESDREFAAWRAAVASVLRVNADHIRIVGSAATGFSLSPLKPGRPFRGIQSTRGAISDIDVALVDRSLFDKAWNTVVANDRMRALGGTDESRAKLRADVYWGFVNRKDIPQNTDAARVFLTVEAEASRVPPIRGYPIRFRVYRRMADLRGYHISSLRSLRTELQIS